MGDRELVERFRDLLRESVRLRLMSDVPLGMFLSGGIDSAAIAAVMAREMTGRSRRSRWPSTIAPTASWATRARPPRPSAPSRTRSSSATDDFFGALPRLVWHEDEPIAHPSSVPLHFVSALARAARQGGAHRRGQRRTARRLRPLSAHAAQLERRAGSTNACVPAALRRVVAARRAAAAWTACAVMPRARSWRCRARPRRCSSTTSPASRGAAAAAADARRCGRPRSLRRHARLLQCAPRGIAACSAGCSTPTSRPTSSNC